MAKSKQKKIGKKKQNELGLTGPSVEPLVIKEIETAAEKFSERNDELVSTLETVIEPLEQQRTEAEATLMAAMDKHAVRLIKSDKGALTYRYGEHLVVLKSNKRKVTIKTVHDEVPASEEGES